jgi:vancomycin resistance protein VanJ
MKKSALRIHWKTFSLMPTGCITQASAGSIIRLMAALLVWLYASLIAFWLIWHYHYGDTIWWLALVNSFAPFLFTPLILVVPTGLLVRTRAYWLGLALPLAAFLFLYGALFLPRWPVTYVAQPPPLTMMTFNIWGGSRSKATIHVINQNNLPDIVAIQELSYSMDRRIKDEVSKMYPYQVFDPGTDDEGLGVFSRYPLTQLTSKHLFEPGWQIQLMRVQVGARTFVLYNCHPRSSNVMRYLRDGESVARAVRDSFKLRTLLVKQLMVDIAERTEPVVVVGDFNSTPESDVYSLLTGPLLDAQQEAGWSLGHTFPAYSLSFRSWPLFPRLIRIDMILHSHAFVALSNYVSAAHGESDHLPVVAQLAWRP